MNRFFNIALQMAPYKDNEQLQNGLRESLLECGIYPIDVKEGDLVETATGNKVLEVLIIQCMEATPGIKDIFKAVHNMDEIQYEGLPTLV